MGERLRLSTMISPWSLGRCAALVLASAALAACDQAPASPDGGYLSASRATLAPPPMERIEATLNVGQIVFDVADGGCTPIDPSLDSDAPLFLVPISLAAQQICDVAQLEPILAPEGDQVTLGEWLQATGSVTITCEDGGTRYHFQFKGLIPNGVYTIWHFPGTGGGALASHPPDDIRNVFTANPAGNANFLTFGTAGPMTFFGAVPACTLPISPEAGQFANEVFVVVYHTDNLSFGPFPGPEETTVAHVVFLVEE